jgi:acetyltransferase-like isoleucine patch superfamily enzyme
MRAGHHGIGRAAAWLASLNTAPYHLRAHFAEFKNTGFVAHSACIAHSELEIGAHVYIGDRVVISRSGSSGSVILRDRVHIYGDSFIETGMGGTVDIGSGTHIQPGCHIHSFISKIGIGSDVEIAACCSFYNYSHGTKKDQLIMRQKLVSKGSVSVGDGAWIGHGAVILQGVTIGHGAVVAAGAVVTRDIPDNGIAAGVPARVIGYRESD